jgi:hypothetical protein
MTIRNRTRSTLVATGSHYRLPAFPPTIHSVYSPREDVYDNVLPGNGFAFETNKYWYDGTFPIYNGTYTFTARNFQVDKLPMGRFGDPTYLLAHLPVGGSPTLLDAAAEIVAKTNPSRPLLDFPVFAMELKELPNLLLQRSKDIGRDIARGRLSLEYGWKPLINDLLGLLEFRKEFRSRVIEINSLRKSGLRRKRKLFTGSSTPENYDEQAHNLSGLTVRARGTKVTTTEVWGFVRWRPTADIPRHLGLQNDTAEQKALFALLGLNPYVIDASTIWELIPFSWLADWCSNAGDLMLANRNIVGAYPDKIQVMRRTRTEQSVLEYNGGDSTIYKVCGGAAREFTRYHETQRRDPGSLTLEAHMPFLNERKVMILADIVRNNFPGKVWAK